MRIPIYAFVHRRNMISLCASDTIIVKCIFFFYMQKQKFLSQWDSIHSLIMQYYAVTHNNVLLCNNTTFAYAHVYVFRAPIQLSHPVWSPFSPPASSTRHWLMIDAYHLAANAHSRSYNRISFARSSDDGWLSDEYLSTTVILYN